MEPAGLSTRQMSSTTRTLFEMEHEFVKATSRETTCGKILAAVVGRILFITISFFVHAEAFIRRAVLSWKVISCHPDTAAIAKQKEASAAAYAVSMKSLYACLNQNTFERTESPSIQPAAPEPALLPLAPPVRNPVQAPLAADIALPIRRAEPIEDRAPLAAEPDVVFVEAPLREEPVVVDARAPSHDDEPVVVDARAPSHDDEPVVVDARMPSHDDEPVAMGGPSPWREEDGVDVGAGPAEPLPIFPPRLRHQEPLASAIAERENRVYNDAEIVASKLERALLAAQEELRSERPGGFMLQRGFDALRTDPRWDMSSQTIGNVNVRMCQYSPQPESKGTQLATSFNIRIGRVDYPVKLFGVFEAFGNPLAAQYIKNNLPGVLAGLLRKHNNLGELTGLGIANALKLVFVELDKGFKAEYRNMADLASQRYITDGGATGSVVIILEKGVWTANLGNGEVFLSIKDRYPPVSSMSIPAQPDREEFRRGVAKRGGFVENGLVCGEVPSARGIGFSHLNGAVSSRPKISAIDLPPSGRIFIATGLRKSYSIGELHEAMSERPAEATPFNILCSLVHLRSEIGNASCMTLDIEEEPHSEEASVARDEVGSALLSPPPHAAGAAAGAANVELVGASPRTPGDDFHEAHVSSDDEVAAEAEEARSAVPSAAASGSIGTAVSSGLRRLLPW